jgi:hypothetical protein
MLNCCTMPRTIFGCWRSFFPNTATSGCTREELQHDRADAMEEAGAERAVELVGERRRLYAVHLRRRIHLVLPRREQHVDAAALEAGAIGVDRARVTVEILVGVRTAAG